MGIKLQGNDQQILLKWWLWLDDNRGHRAKLRRATTPQDIMMMDAFFKFLKFTTKIDDENDCLSDDWHKPENFYTAATLCGLLSKVKTNAAEVLTSIALDENEQDLKKEKRTLNFASQLAMPNSGGSSPVMSELRFSRLQKSESVDSFYLNMSRAIDLLNGAVHLNSMIKDTLHWCNEFESGANKEPRKRLAVRWATEYFTTLTHNKLA